MTTAIIGMVGFLSPMFLLSDQEDPPLKLKDGRWQQRVVLWIPLAIGAPFLLLTWMLLLAEVDGTNLAWHEIFGLPLVVWYDFPQYPVRLHDGRISAWRCRPLVL